MQGLMPVPLFVDHLAGVFAHNKLAPDGRRVGVQCKPQCKNA